MLLERLDTVIAFVSILLGVSLLLMIVTQAISALLNLRGNSLSTGVQTLFTTSGMPHREAKKLAQRVLRHELISDNSKMSKSHRPATTVRQSELENILDTVYMEDAARVTASHQNEVSKLEKQIEETEREIEACDGDDAHLEEKMKLREKLKEKLHKLRVELGHLKDRIEREIDKRRQQLQKVKAHVHVWFDSVMDRTSQRFVRHTRIVTAILSLIAAFALHLDALSLYDRLAKDGELRDSLVASSKQLMDDASGMLDEDRNVVPTAYQGALDDMKMLTPQVIERAIGKEAIEPISNLPAPESPIASRRDAESWLDSKLGDIPETVKKKAIAEYHKKVEARLTRSLERLRDSALAIKGDLDASEFQLIPSPYPSFWTYFQDGLHFLGTLAMAALLSLGAPFWFDALKKLMSVRPVLAGKVEQEQHSKPKKSKMPLGDPGLDSEGDSEGEDEGGGDGEGEGEGEDK